MHISMSAVFILFGVAFVSNCFCQEDGIFPKMDDTQFENAYEQALPLLQQWEKTAKARDWNSGKFAVFATPIAIVEDKIRLRKQDGKSIKVPIERLSKVDQEFLSRHKSTLSSWQDFIEEFGWPPSIVVAEKKLRSRNIKARTRLLEITRKETELIRFEQKLREQEKLIKTAGAQQVIENAPLSVDQPIQILSGQIADGGIGKELNLKFKNVSKKTISAVTFEIESFNDFGEKLDGFATTGRLITQDDILSGASDSGDWTLSFNGTASKTVAFPSEAVFLDGSKWAANDKTPKTTIE